MTVSGSRVAVVGGSIAGCAAAIALRRAGCDVTVYERSRGALAERGFGIAIPAALHDELVSAGYLDAGTPACRISERSWFAADGGSAAGRLLAAQPTPELACENWALLWNGLRAAVPDAAYRSGTAVTGIRPDGDRPTITFFDGGAERFDLIVGADGYNSAVRRLVAPGVSPRLAGYGLWRATCPESALPAPARELLETGAVTLVFPGGHAGAYLIPDHLRPGGRLLNWFAYLDPPEPFADPRMILPGTVDGRLLDLLERVLDRRCPPSWAEAFRCARRDQISVQPVFDLTVASYASGRLVVLGDAGAVARPHTASGATTALLDALALERWCRGGGDWEETLAGYDRERSGAGNEQVELGRVLGAALVTSGPDWRGMSAVGFRRWWGSLVAGHRSFLDG